MNTQIFHLKKCDIEGYEGPKSSSNFSVNPTLPLMDGPLMLSSQIVCIFLSLTLHLVLLFPSLSLTLSLYPSLPPSFAPCKH